MQGRVALAESLAVERAGSSRHNAAKFFLTSFFTAAALLTGLVLRRTDEALFDQLSLDAGRGARFRLERIRLASSVR